VRSPSPYYKVSEKAGKRVPKERERMFGRVQKSLKGSIMIEDVPQEDCLSIKRKEGRTAEGTGVGTEWEHVPYSEGRTDLV